MNMLIAIPFVVLFGAYLFFLFGSVFSSKLLTSWQKRPLENFIFFQIAFIFMISLMVLFIDDALVEATYKNKLFLAISVFSAAALFVVRKTIKRKEQQIIHARTESTFDLQPLQPMERSVDKKNINRFSHYFAGVKLKRAQKDFSVREISSNFSKKQIIDFIKKQKRTPFEIDNFYKELVGFINSKSELLGFEKLKIDDLVTYNLLKAKVQIYRSFQNLTDKKYYASISQLSQIATSDEMCFLSFLRDSQHQKYCNISILHALAFIEIKVL